MKGVVMRLGSPRLTTIWTSRTAVGAASSNHIRGRGTCLAPNPAAKPRLLTTFPGHLGFGVLPAMLTYAWATYPLVILVNQ